MIGEPMNLEPRIMNLVPTCHTSTSVAAHHAQHDRLRSTYPTTLIHSLDLLFTSLFFFGYS